jgi:hypothetical protein
LQKNRIRGQRWCHARGPGGPRRCTAATRRERTEPERFRRDVYAFPTTRDCLIPGAQRPCSGTGSPPDLLQIEQVGQEQDGVLA